MTPRRMMMVARDVVLVLVVTLTGMNTAVWAQEGMGPPPPGFDRPPEGGPPGMVSPEKELAHLRKRYHLTEAQQSAIAPLIKEREDKLKALFSDAALDRQEVFPKAEAIHLETNKKIEAILDPSQRAKFQADEAKQAARAKQRPDDMGDYGPPPPPPDGGAGPPP